MNKRYSILELEALIESGEQYMRLGMERDALEALAKAFRAIPWECDDERRPILKRAYDGLRSLIFSDDEYVWESVSSLTDGFDRFH